MLRSAARVAEDSGDFEGALRLVSQLPADPCTRRWRQQLLDAARLAESDSPGLARWLVNPAVRWAQERPVGQVLDSYARLMLTVLGSPISDRQGELEEIAATDPMVLDAGLFDGGLFARYLAEGARRAVVERAGPVAFWAAQPASIWQLCEVAGDAVLLRDLASDEEQPSLGWPSAASLAQQALLYGRLVPVEGPVPQAFALPPVAVDQRCAARLLRARRRRSGPQERLRAVARSRRREVRAPERPA